jgi:hypothetical protein
VDFNARALCWLDRSDGRWRAPTMQISDHNLLIGIAIKSCCVQLDGTAIVGS